MTLGADCSGCQIMICLAGNAGQILLVGWAIQRRHELALHRYYFIFNSAKHRDSFQIFFNKPSYVAIFEIEKVVQASILEVDALGPPPRGCYHGSLYAEDTQKLISYEAGRKVMTSKHHRDLLPIDNVL